ncbi:MAG: hypothetical protein WD066_04965 [Planctomycetaceae bacterium]
MIDASVRELATVAGVVDATIQNWIAGVERKGCPGLKIDRTDGGPQESSRTCYWWVLPETAVAATRALPHADSTGPTRELDR